MVYPHTFRTEHSETRTTNGIYGEYYARMKEKKIPIQPQLLEILQYVDSNRVNILNYLKEAIEIKSISGDMKYRSEVKRMIKFTEKWFVRLGIKYECFDIGSYEVDGKKVKLPSIILATVGKDSSKKTVCVYTYLDVKHPNKSNWSSNPWELTEVDKKRLFGCGVAGGKSSLISWFSLLKGFKDSEVDIPVNIKFIIQSMHYQNNAGLEDFLLLRKQDFLYNVDYVVVTDSEWIGDKYPCLTYGSVGILHFEVIIEKAENSTTEPKEDMIKLFENITDDKEQILVPKFNEIVQQITPDEEQIYEAITEFNVDDIRDSLPPFKKNWDKVQVLMHFWRLPSLLVGDIEECNCEKDDKNIVKRSFMVKIVPRQIIETASPQMLNHIRKTCKTLNIENNVSAELISASRPWVEDILSTNYQAARRATIQIYKEEPNWIREDRDMKTVSILSRIIDKSVLVLPLGDKHSNAGGDNENIGIKNYYEGVKLLGAYIMQLAYTIGETEKKCC